MATHLEMLKGPQNQEQTQQRIRESIQQQEHRQWLQLGPTRELLEELEEQRSKLQRRAEILADKGSSSTGEILALLNRANQIHITVERIKAGKEN